MLVRGCITTASFSDLAAANHQAAGTGLSLVLLIYSFGGLSGAQWVFCVLIVDFHVADCDHGFSN